MENSPLTSVIIPVYNTGDTLRSCIESVEASTYANLEIVLIDDGSLAETRKICDECAEDYSNIIVKHVLNGGVSSARNQGLELCRGEYIAFVDADDRIAPNMIELMVNECLSSVSDMCVCGYEELYRNGTNRSYSPEGSDSPLRGDDLIRSFFREQLIGWNAWAKLFKRDVVQDIRFPEDRRIAEDMFFVYQACLKARSLCIVSDILYVYDRRGESAMSDSDVAKHFDAYDLVQTVWKKEKDAHAGDALVFYLDKATWFLCFMYARRADLRYAERLEKAQQEVLLAYDADAARSLIRVRQIELWLLRHFRPGFVLFARSQRRWA